MKKNILTIEDSKALNYVLNTVFEKEYEVTSVNNYSDAFDHLQSNISNDLIIINIPDTESDNFHFLEHISTSYKFRNIPKVVISRSADAQLKEKLEGLGASLFLTKPFDPVFLSNKVQDLIYTKGKKTKKRLSFNLNIF
jgi:CheY-like chemotaxis protein